MPFAVPEIFNAIGLIRLIDKFHLSIRDLPYEIINLAFRFFKPGNFNTTLMNNTEYYHDGAVRMEQDYSDARGYGDDPEVGIGKVYTRHGTVKFEWFLINSEPVGFKKSYNQKGGLVDTVYFDEYGQVIEPEQALPSVADAPSANILMNSEILAPPQTSPIP